jgi:hypothetical protein
VARTSTRATTLDSRSHPVSGRRRRRKRRIDFDGGGDAAHSPQVAMPSPRFHSRTHTGHHTRQPQNARCVEQMRALQGQGDNGGRGVLPHPTPHPLSSRAKGKSAAPRTRKTTAACLPPPCPQRHRGPLIARFARLALIDEGGTQVYTFK